MGAICVALAAIDEDDRNERFDRSETRFKK